MKQTKKEDLSMEKIKRERLEFVDLARGMAVIFMIAVHVLMVYANNTVKESPFGVVVEFLGGPPAAPVFMFLMGLSFIYASKKDLQTSIFRGLKIFLAGYILNFFRAVLPIYALNEFAPEFLNGSGIENISYVTLLTIVDILQLAGLSIIILALVREFKLNKYIILSAAIVISLISPILWGIKTNQPLINFIFDLFWGDNPAFSFRGNTVSFPLFPWVAFPLLGYFFGIMINETGSKDKVLLHSLIPGGVSFIVGVALLVNNFDYHVNDYYHARIGLMLLMSGFIVIWLFLCNALVRQIKSNPIFNGFYYLSKSVTNIYFIHWVVIMWGIAIWGENKGTADTILIMIGVFIVSLLVNYGVTYTREKLRLKSIK
jgi:uncharacterized membrane protein